MNANELVGPHRGFRQLGDRQGRGVGRKDAIFAHNVLNLFGHLGLNTDVLKDSLYDQITALKRLKIRGRIDQTQHLFFLLRRGLLACDALVGKGFDIGAALVRSLLVAVDQNNFDAGFGRDQGNARAHHTCAQNTNFLDGLIGNRWTVRAFLQGLFVDEEASDHGRGAWVHKHMGEPACLDLDCSVKGHQSAFVDRRQHRFGRRVNTLRVAIDHGVCTDKGHETRWVIRCAAWHFIAFFIPRFDDFGLGQNPSLCIGHRILGDLINQSCRFGFLRIRELTLQQERRSRHRAQLAGQTGGAAHAREDANHDFRQANLGLWIVRRKNAVTGQRDLKANAQCSARQHTGNRLSAFVGLWIHTRALDFAQDAVGLHQTIHQALLRRAAGHFFHLRDDVQVHTAGK